MNNPDIDLVQCRARQQRLLAVMQEKNLDLVIVQRIEHVQYLAGPRFGIVFEPAAALDASGHLTLIAPQTAPTVAAADEVHTYVAKSHSTLRNDQREYCSNVLRDLLAAKHAAQRIGVEFSCFSPHVARSLKAELVDIEPDLFRLRRRKHTDELARLQRAIDATGAMYRRAREIVRPGVNELDVFNELQSVAVKTCGEMITGTGNDYASGERGGAPRNREAQDGELYILDLGPAYRGYFGDTCRTLAVSGEPTEAQLRCWRHILPVFELIETSVRPGVSCKSIFDTVQQHMDSYAPGLFNHHLGHGIGLFPHEGPHINPFWDDTFEEGDVFTIEPGLYEPSLRTGIRLENDYLVTAQGVRLLSNFPLDL